MKKYLHPTKSRACLHKQVYLRRQACLRRQGFTLIELLIVIAIIGILAAVLIAVINPAKQQNKAKDAVIKSTMEKMVLAINTYYSAYGKYPTCTELNAEFNTGALAIAGTNPKCTVSSGPATSNTTGGRYDATNGEVSFPAQGTSGYWYWSPTIGNIGVGTTNVQAW